MNHRSILTIALCVAISQRAIAEDWKKIGVDKDGLGNDMRVIEVDANSIRKSSDVVTVTIRTTDQAMGGGGYSCKEGDIRHGNVAKNVSDLLCSRETAANHDQPHDPKWETIETRKQKGGETKTQVDLNSLLRTEDWAMVDRRYVSVLTSTISFDCIGFFKREGVSTWSDLKMLDNAPNRPPGFVSLEAKISQFACSRKP